MNRTQLAVALSSNSVFLLPHACHLWLYHHPLTGQWCTDGHIVTADTIIEHRHRSVGEERRIALDLLEYFHFAVGEFLLLHTFHAPHFVTLCCATMPHQMILCCSMCPHSTDGQTRGRTGTENTARLMDDRYKSGVRAIDMCKREEFADSPQFLCRCWSLVVDVHFIAERCAVATGPCGHWTKLSCGIVPRTNKNTKVFRLFSSGDDRGSGSGNRHRIIVVVAELMMMMMSHVRPVALQEREIYYLFDGHGKPLR